MEKVFDSITEREDKKGSLFLDVLGIVLLVLTVVFLVFNILFIKVEVKGESMENTLIDGDKIFIARYAKIEYGDVIVIQGENAKEWIIKRVIAKEGDSVKIENGYVYLKKAGAKGYSQLNEPYIKEQGKTFYYDDDRHQLTDKHEFVIPKGQIFYLGDNRQNSTDSRSDYFTCSQSQVVGVLCSWSLKSR